MASFFEIIKYGTKFLKIINVNHEFFSFPSYSALADACIQIIGENKRKNKELSVRLDGTNGLTPIQNKAGKERKRMSEKEKKIFETFSEITPHLSESDKSYLLGLGEGMAMRAKRERQQAQEE